MKIDLNELEALARAATPGPWEATRQTDDECSFMGYFIEAGDKTISDDGTAPGHADALFIAAANPAAVLDLIALARQADTIHIPVLTDAELIARFPLPGAPVQRITLSHGAYVERETKTTGEPGWLLCAPDGTAVRGLNEYEAEFIDSALRAASEPAQPVQQPAPVAVPAELLEAICHMARGYGNSETFRPQFESKLRYFWPAASVHDKQEQEYIGIRLRRVAKVAGVTVDYGNDADYYAGAFSILGHIARALDVPATSVHPFQQRVQPWMMACFGAEISADTKERNHRFFEESTELVQACGMTASEAHQLVDYVYGRPVGEPVQEAGGVMVTLAALCLANGLDMHQAAEVELARIWTKVEAIRAKQAAKPKHSPLPALPNAEASIEAALTAFCDQEGYPSDGPMDGVLRKAFAAGASFAFDWKGRA